MRAASPFLNGTEVRPGMTSLPSDSGRHACTAPRSIAKGTACGSTSMPRPASNAGTRRARVSWSLLMDGLQFAGEGAGEDALGELRLLLGLRALVLEELAGRLGSAEEAAGHPLLHVESGDGNGSRKERLGGQALRAVTRGVDRVEQVGGRSHQHEGEAVRAEAAGGGAGSLVLVDADRRPGERTAE